jgi:hypothetical protein
MNATELAANQFRMTQTSPDNERLLTRPPSNKGHARSRNSDVCIRPTTTVIELHFHSGAEHPGI